MNNIILCKTSQLWEKIYIFLCVGLEFRNHNSFFISCYCLFPGFSQASTSFFTSAFDIALFMTSHFGEQPTSLLRRSRNPAGNSVWLRGKTSEAQRTSSKRGRRQATEIEWNFSVSPTLRVSVRTRCNSLLLPTDFLYSLFIKITFEQLFANWTVKASKLHSLEWSTNKTHVKSFKYINRHSEHQRKQWECKLQNSSKKFTPLHNITTVIETFKKKTKWQKYKHPTSIFTIAQNTLPSPAYPNISPAFPIALPGHSMCKISASNLTFSLWANPRKKQLE